MTIVKEGFVSTDSKTNETPYSSQASIIRALRTALIAENDAANQYENIIDSILACSFYSINSPLEKVVLTIRDIANEEKKHIGEFTKLLSMIDYDDIENYKLGVKEV